MQILNLQSLLVLAVIFGLTGEVSAQVAKSKGKGQVVYKGFRPKSSDERNALILAKKNAVTRYAANFNGSRFELYKKVEAKLLDNIEDIVVDFTIIDEQRDSTSKRYSVIIEASINTALIEREIQKNTAAAPVRPAASASGRSGVRGAGG